MDFEQTIMMLLIRAGEARSHAMSAIQHARQRDWPAAEQALAASVEAAKGAHHIQTQLIGADQGAGKVPVTLIMAHAQDHLMNAMLCRELAEEIVLLRKELFASPQANTPAGPPE